MEKTLKTSSGASSPIFGRGVRFAPSPTGRFHLGNLRTAWLSHRFAREWGEPWVLRFEDIDAPRTLAGAQARQLEDMAALGLNADQVILQSDLSARHWQVFERAVSERRVYPCYCSRKDVREALERAASAPHGPTATYSGHCRASSGAAGWASATSRGATSGVTHIAWRFAVDEDSSGRSDFIVARSAIALNEQRLPIDRAQFAPAYHWACAIDDWDGNYRLLVRAWDLAEILDQHRAIMRWLGGVEHALSGRAEAESARGARVSATTMTSGGNAAVAVPRGAPAVFHTSLVTQDDGHRLEKRTRGVTLDEFGDVAVVLRAFERSVVGEWPTLLAQWAPGAVWGEARRAVTVSELLGTRSLRGY